MAWAVYSLKVPVLKKVRVRQGSSCKPGCSGNQCTAIRAAFPDESMDSESGMPSRKSPHFSFGAAGPVRTVRPRGSPIDETWDAGRRIAWAASPVIPGIRIQYAAPNCSARGQDQTSMILTEEIEQTKASDARPGDSTRRWIGVRIY